VLKLTKTMQMERCVSCGIILNGSFLLYFFLSSMQLTSTTAGRSRSIHAGILQYFDKFAAKCADILLNFVYIIFRDTFALRLTLLNGDISSYQIPHDALIPEVTLGSLLDFSLRQKLEIEALQLRNFPSQNSIFRISPQAAFQSRILWIMYTSKSL